MRKALQATLVAMLLALAVGTLPSPSAQAAVPLWTWHQVTATNTNIQPYTGGGALANRDDDGQLPYPGNQITVVKASGNIADTVPYLNQQFDNPVKVNATGQIFRVHRVLGSNGYPLPSAQLIANGVNLPHWSKPVQGDRYLMAVGTDSNIYLSAHSIAADTETLTGYAKDGSQLFSPYTLHGFTNGGDLDQLYAWHGGLVLYSGNNKAQYFGYNGLPIGPPIVVPITIPSDKAPAKQVTQSWGPQLTGRKITINTPPGGSFCPKNFPWWSRETAINPITGAVYVLTHKDHYSDVPPFPDGTTSEISIVIIKPGGLVPKLRLPNVNWCRTGGPYLSVMPKGGFLITTTTPTNNETPGQPVRGMVRLRWFDDNTVQPRSDLTYDVPGGTIMGALAQPEVDLGNQIIVAHTVREECNRPNPCFSVQLQRLATTSGQLTKIDTYLIGHTGARDNWAVLDKLTTVAGQAVVPLLYTPDDIADHDMEPSISGFTFSANSGAPALTTEFTVGTTWNGGITK